MCLYLLEVDLRIEVDPNQKIVDLAAEGNGHLDTQNDRHGKFDSDRLHGFAEEAHCKGFVADDDMDPADYTGEDNCSADKPASMHSFLYYYVSFDAYRDDPSAYP